MVMDVQKRIVELHNEVKSQKVFSGLTYSQLLLPENSPVQTYSGTISLSGSGLISRLRFRFERKDGLLDTPMISFAYSASISPTYKSFAESNGFSFSANDLSYLDNQNISGYIGEIGDGYVDFYVDFGAALRDMFFSLSSLSISVTCQAISNVLGNLSVEKII